MMKVDKLRSQKDLKILWKAEEQRAFQGWNFSQLDGRLYTEPLPWDYKRIISDYLKQTDILLDIGTGGGEFLLTLGHPPENTYVTESWPPNATLCFERLTPLGIHVYELVDQSLYPFQDSSFDLVINRHASYNLDEISRILKPGGYFITQQVGSENNRLLSERLNPNAQPLYPNFSLKTEKPQINARGFEVVYGNEHYPEARYFDTGAIVYLAKVIEWEFPHFSVDRDFTQLLQLQRDIEHQGYILSREHRFVIVARKKNA